MKPLPTLSGKNLLVTGIHGFLGAHTGALGLRTGARVYGVDLPGSSTRGEKVVKSLAGEPISTREADLAGAQAWADILADTNPHIVYHLAGSTRRGGAAADWRANIVGNLWTTSSLVEAVLSLPEAQRPIVIYPGSQMEYGLAPLPWTEETQCRPVNPYGASKLAATDLLLSAGRADRLKACVARLPIVYGPAQLPTLLIPALICSALSGTDFKMTEGTQRRRFLYVEDAASLLLSVGAGLLQGKNIPSLMNMPACPPRPIREVADMILEYLKHPIALQVGELPGRAWEGAESGPDDSLARQAGFSCETHLEEGLRQTVEWYRTNPWFREGGAW
jgi:nucleoside-diphosphate-sugar epimerase